MKKLLLASLIFLTSCSDRYDVVRNLEASLPGVNIESFDIHSYIATYQNKSIYFNIEYSKTRIKEINSNPERDIVFVGRVELIPTLKKMFDIVEEVK